MKVEFKTLDKCKPRDLVRIQLGNQTEWALVGKRSSEFLPVLILKRDGTAHCVNVMGDMDILQHPFDKTVLCYGQDYVLTANHAGPCELVSGASSAQDGMAIQSQSDFYVCGDFPQRRGKGYYDILTGELVSSAPGGSLAIFPEWDLWLVENGKPSIVILNRRVASP